MAPPLSWWDGLTSRVSPANRGSIRGWSIELEHRRRSVSPPTRAGVSRKGEDDATRVVLGVAHLVVVLSAERRVVPSSGAWRPVVEPQGRAGGRPDDDPGDRLVIGVLENVPVGRH